MADTFKLAKMSSVVAELINQGRYLGFRDAIARARKAHSHAARKGSVSDGMVLANVYYSAAANMAESGIFYKPLAPVFLFLSKFYAVKAFKSQGKVNSLSRSLVLIDTSMRMKVSRPIGPGDVQILQSIFFQWRVLKKMFRLDATYEQKVVEECAKIIDQSGDELISVLSSCILFQMYEKYSEESINAKKRIIEFICRYHNKAMKAGVPMDVAQTLSRAARAIGLITTAQDVAKKYRLDDQLHKAGK